MERRRRGRRKGGWNHLSSCIRACPREQSGRGRKAARAECESKQIAQAGPHQVLFNNNITAPIQVLLKLLGLVHSLPLNAGTNPLFSHHLCVSSFLATESSNASSISKNLYSISSPLSSHQLRTSVCPCRVATMRTSLSNTRGKRECFHQSRRGTLPVLERWYRANLE